MIATVEEALSLLQQDPHRMVFVREDASPIARWQLERVVVDFAVAQARMIESMCRISFPIPKHLKVTLDPDNAEDCVFVHEETARRIYAALGEALAKEKP